MTRRSRLAALPPTLAVLVLLACSGCGGGDSTTPDPQPGLANAALAVAASAPMGRVGITGLPSAKSYAGYEVRILGPDGATLFTMPVEEPVEEPIEDLPWFLAPLNPDQPTEGGPIRLVVTDGTATSPELTLDLGGLPEAPGAFARYVEHLRSHIDQRAVAEGSSFAELSASTIAATEPRLLPLKFAQVFVDDPGHAHSLARIADGTSDYLDATQRDVLDRIFGYANIDSLVVADIDHMGDPQPPAFAWYGGAPGPDKACVNMGPIISTAPQLAEAMQEAFASKVAVDPSGAPGRILGATGLALGAAAFVPGLGPVAAVAGAGLYAYQTSREYKANTYPSAFVSLDFVLDRDWMPEDEPGFARWSDVYVVAKSNGWVADKAVFDAVMQLTGAALGASQVGRIRGSTALRDAAVADVGMSVGLYLDGQPSGVVEFCSQQWRVDITDLPYSEGRAVIGRVATSDFREITPVMVGEDFVEVRAVSEQFGWRTIAAQLPIETRAIRVTVTPDVIYVDTPGEVVQVTAAIENADNESLYWTADKGTWNDGHGEPTNGPSTRPLLTPTAEADYPFVVTVESLSRQGLRAANDPPRVDTAVVRLRSGAITVTPGYACVASGESRTFVATVEGLDNTDVTWSLEPAVEGGAVVGAITAGGVYTAPAVGNATMRAVATSVADPTVRGWAELEAGVCSCRWDLSIDGDGAFGGDWVTHGYASQWGIFTITFNGVNSGGTSIAPLGGPEPGQTGSWPVTFSFLAGDRAWAAGGNDDGTSATLTVYEHGEQMVAEITGVCVTAINGEGVLRGFRLTTRSADAASQDMICGEQ